MEESVGTSISVKYLENYYKGFNSDITKYQWPDPFETIDDAKLLLQDFINEMDAKESLIYSILDNSGKFIGSAEVHGLSENCPELGIWISEDEQKKGYAYEALSSALDYVCKNFQKETFFYEADVRNEGSTKLLLKLDNTFDIQKQGLEEITTDSGKDLKLQGYVLKLKK